MIKIAGVQTDSVHPVSVSYADKDTAEGFAHVLRARSLSLPGVVGPLTTVEAFAEAWCAQNNCKQQLITNLRLFQLEAVTPPPLPAGSWREANQKDVDLLIQWTYEFIDEACPHDPKPPIEELRQRVQDGISNQNYFFWDDRHETVCLVASTRDSSAGRWIAPVYTPKNSRGRGYASALVAAVSQRYVNAGRKCLLFTDLANPTSSSIYQKVGYQPLTDFKHINFI